MKFKRGEFVQLGNITMMRGRVIEAKPGLFKNKYKVRMLTHNGQVKTYHESQLKLAKYQSWTF